MGGVLSWWMGGQQGRTDDPDPITKLTSRDVYLIKTSWIPIRKQLTPVGVDLMLKLFEKYPEEKEFFPFRDIPNAKLRNDKKFHAHCNRVMHNVDSIVDNIADVDLLIEILNKIGESHQLRGVPAQSFWNVKDIMVTDMFPKIMNKETLDAWNRALDVAFGVVAKSL